MTASQKPDLEQLRAYITEHEEYVHFTVVPRSDGAFDVALVFDGGYESEDAAAVVAKAFAEENRLSYRPESLPL